MKRELNSLVSFDSATPSTALVAQLCLYAINGLVEKGARDVGITEVGQRDGGGTFVRFSGWVDAT